MNATCYCYDCHGIRVIISRAKEVQNALQNGNEAQIERFIRDLKNATKAFDSVLGCTHNSNRD